MSENIPESIPTSADPRSKRPIKKIRSGPVTATSQQASSLDALFANPDKQIRLPSSALARTFAAPPEIVTNVQGSSAGAGSGEFHVYKASRRREYERLRVMDEEVQKEEGDREFEAKQAELRKRDEEKTSKNQKKRAKAKMRKERAKDGVRGGGEDGIVSMATDENEEAVEGASGSNEVKDSGEVKTAEDIGLIFHDED